MLTYFIFYGKHFFAGDPNLLIFQVNSCQNSIPLSFYLSWAVTFASNLLLFLAALPLDQRKIT